MIPKFDFNTSYTLILLLFLASCSLKNDKKTQMDVLLNAQQLGDFQTAIQSIHTLRALEPEERMWHDSLAMTYFRAKRFEEAYRSSKVSLAGAHKDQSEQLIRVAAESSKVLGLHDESLKLHLRLLEYTPKDPILLYDIGLLYFSLLQLEVGIQYMNRVIECPDASTLLIAVRNDNGEQEVRYMAAAYNAKGYGLTELGKFEEAEEALAEALKLEPLFNNAQSNLQYLKVKAKQVKVE